MMNHLSPAEFVDAADRALLPARAAHLEECARCREQVSAVRDAVAAAETAGVPEPSPLYWRNMAARIHDRVAAETITPAWRVGAWREWLALRTLVPVASALALVAAVMVAGAMRVRPVAPPAPGTVAAVATPSDSAVETGDSAAWEELTSAAADMPLEDAHAAGLGVAPGAVDRAVQRMTPDELTELGHLLQTEMHRSGD